MDDNEYYTDYFIVGVPHVGAVHPVQMQFQ